MPYQTNALARAATRWILVCMLLTLLACGINLSESVIDQASAFICPAGWWHTSEFWAHCAYPPISILKHGLIYGLFGTTALTVIWFAVPAFKRQSGGILLLILLAMPAWRLLVKFSWVELSKLVVATLVAFAFVAICVWRSRLPVQDQQGASAT